MRFELFSTVFVSYLVGLCAAEDVQPGTMTWADKLKKDLFVNYDRTNRPTQHYNVTNVKVGMSVRHIDIDEVSSIFTVSNWINMEWTDEKLRWNPEDYGDLKIIRTSAESIWKPDLLLYNNAKTSNIDHFGLTDVLIYNDGKILWVPPTDFHTFCRLNLRLWPFDQQTCHVKLGSWVHDALSLNLTLNTKPGVDTTDDESEVWTIQNITVRHNTVTYECCPEPYVDVEYFFTVKRTSSCYVVVVSPIILILLLTLSVFWLPPHCPEKIVLNGIVMMIATALLIYFSIQLPIRYGNAPLVVIFTITTLFQTAFGATLSAIVIKICRIKHTRPVPRLLRRALLEGRLESMLELGCTLLPPYEDKEIEGNQEEIGDVAIRDWCRLAGLLDRGIFASYLVMFCIAFVWCVV
ncbi:neuronal acetylcholine receptor subunit alpha-4 [Culex quinquefasciatus]|uniref:Neuronal acetylcholine receptor subunit alpha-4 n=1 Tax=Culex quinquefasciatus TaxID=7176 RepID=B0W5Q9_CULQU|nr:neuronal acetylcholine receptor subunit alpha-4 [Culex quinquefasciatus]|eukprot:XP_001844043.1 neuronal acetylcholine receptor subunit alpha-4 [Culex quinquefasciatus]